MPQHRGSLPVAHQPDPHQVVPGTAAGWGCGPSRTRGTIPIWVIGTGGWAIAPIKHARVLGIDMGLGAPVQNVALLPLLHLLPLLN